MNRHDDTKALGKLMIALMEEGDDSEVSSGSSYPPLGLENPEQWSAEAVEFLSLTMAVGVEDLAQVGKGPSSWTAQCADLISIHF